MDLNRYQLCGMILAVFLLQADVFPLPAAEMPPVHLQPQEVNLGDVDPTAAIRREVRLRADEAILEVRRLMSSCPCVTLTADRQLPATLQVGEAMTLTVTIDVASYEGRFSKTAFIQVVTPDGEATLLRLPISGTIADPRGPEVAGGHGGSRVTGPKDAPVEEYRQDMPRAKVEAGLVLFVTPECDSCTWVKLIWLPRFRQAYPDTRVVFVDLTSKDGLDLFLDVELRLNPRPEQGQQAPVAWWKGTLTYGTQAIERLGPYKPSAPADESARGKHSQADPGEMKVNGDERRH